MKNNQLKHLGYTGSLEVSLEDDCMHGKILFINDLITYEAESVSGITAAFEEAVDQYLKYCKETNSPANRPFSGSFNVRISPDLHKAAAMQAASNGQTLNEFIKDAINTSVNNTKLDDVVRHQHTLTVKHESQYSVEESQTWTQKSQENQPPNNIH